MAPEQLRGSCGPAPHHLLTGLFGTPDLHRLDTYRGCGGYRSLERALTELTPDDLTTTLHRLTGWALEQHVQLTGLEVIRPSLEDVYLSLTGDPPEPAGPASRRGRRRL